MRNPFKFGRVLSLGSIRQAEFAPYFSVAWDRLSLHRRQVLQALARGGGRNVFAREFPQTHRLGPHSSVQASLRQLTKEQVVFKADKEYRLADPFFQEWIGAHPA